MLAVSFTFTVGESTMYVIRLLNGWGHTLSLIETSSRHTAHILMECLCEHRSAARAVLTSTHGSHSVLFLGEQRRFAA
jgi:hypothetical protein